jgi:hypothetical protein
MRAMIASVMVPSATADRITWRIASPSTAQLPGKQRIEDYGVRIRSPMPRGGPRMPVGPQAVLVSLTPL